MHKSAFRSSKGYSRASSVSSRGTYSAKSLLLARNLAPYLRNTTGIGIINVARHARSVPAHFGVKFSNICVVKSGKPEAIADRSMMFAATVEAALCSVSISVVVLEVCLEAHNGR